MSKQISSNRYPHTRSAVLTFWNLSSQIKKNIGHVSYRRRDHTPSLSCPLDSVVRSVQQRSAWGTRPRTIPEALTAIILVAAIPPSASSPKVTRSLPTTGLVSTKPRQVFRFICLTFPSILRMFTSPPTASSATSLHCPDYRYILVRLPLCYSCLLLQWLRFEFVEIPTTFTISAISSRFSFFAQQAD